MRMLFPQFTLLAAMSPLALALVRAAPGQIILEDHFDAPAVSGWVSQGNTQVFSAHRITQAGSVITSEVVPTAGNTNRGIVSEASFAPAATEAFTMTFVADSISTQPDQYRATTTAKRFPRLADNDADSLPNNYEFRFGLDPDSPKDALGDLDGDGTSIRDERIAGTDPTDADEFFRIVSAQQQPNDITIRWPSAAGKTYRVFVSSDLLVWSADAELTGTGDELTTHIPKPAQPADQLSIRVVVIR
jgi:hypothetical protein